VSESHCPDRWRDLCDGQSSHHQTERNDSECPPHDRLRREGLTRINVLQSGQLQPKGYSLVGEALRRRQGKHAVQALPGTQGFLPPGNAVRGYRFHKTVDCRRKMYRYGAMAAHWFTAQSSRYPVTTTDVAVLSKLPFIDICTVTVLPASA